MATKRAPLGTTSASPSTDSRPTVASMFDPSDPLSQIPTDAGPDCATVLQDHGCGSTAGSARPCRAPIGRPTATICRGSSATEGVRLLTPCRGASESSLPSGGNVLPGEETDGLSPRRLACHASERLLECARVAQFGSQEWITMACTADDRRIPPSKSMMKASPRVIGTCTAAPCMTWARAASPSGVRTTQPSPSKA
jgi:hypothetical protein